MRILASKVKSLFRERVSDRWMRAMNARYKKKTTTEKKQMCRTMTKCCSKFLPPKTTIWSTSLTRVAIDGPWCSAVPVALLLTTHGSSFIQEMGLRKILVRLSQDPSGRNTVTRTADHNCSHRQNVSPTIQPCHQRSLHNREKAAMYADALQQMRSATASTLQLRTTARSLGCRQSLPDQINECL